MGNSNQLAHPKYRPDIDGLRAIAVLAVVIFHAFPSSMKGGFIGVDIFFVISGFLISTIIIKSLENSTFSITEFYVRRIKRIFPALIVMLLACLIFGWFYLLSAEFKQLGKHITGGTAFVANLVLLSESGYFDNNSITKPLLHLWSLGIEEQFYFILPPLLWMSWRLRFNHLIVIILMASCSFILNMKGVSLEPTATFYSPQTRFWELLMGSFLAQLTIILQRHDQQKLHVLNPIIKRIDSPVSVNLQSIIGIFFLLIGFIKITHDSKFPGYLAFLPVAGAMLLINAGSKAWINKYILSHKVLVWFGLISFPLYLWHWPLLSFAHILARGEPEPYLRIALVLFSFFLSWLTYKFIESPIRHKNIPFVTGLLCGLCVCICLLGFITYRNDGFKHRFPELEKFNDIPTDKSLMSNEKCVTKYKKLFVPDFIIERDFCLDQNNQAKNVLLIGDSHAGKLYEGFLDMGYSNIIHIGRGSCPPLMQLDPNEKWFNCQPTLNNIINFALNSEFELLIIHGVFERYFDGYYKLDLTEPQIDQALKDFFEAIGQSGKDALIILDNPSLPFDPKICVRRPNMNDSISECSFNREMHDKKIDLYKAKFVSFGRKFKNIIIYDPTNLFCDDQKCYAVNSEGMTYTGDYNHLSLRGSKLVNNQLLKLYPELFNISKRGK